MTEHIHEPPPVDAEALQRLLNGELEAVDAYTQVLGTFDDEFVIADLQKIRDEHQRSVRELRDQLVGLGLQLDASKTSAPEASKNHSRPANVAGPVMALAMLRQGEEQGITGYEAALENNRIHPDCLRTIRATLLPACRKHVEQLNSLLGGMGH